MLITFTHIPASTPLTDGSARRLSETGVAAAGFAGGRFSGGDARGLYISSDVLGESTSSGLYTH